MGRAAQSLSARATSDLTKAVRLEYDELRERSARSIRASSQTLKTAAKTRKSVGQIERLGTIPLAASRLRGLAGFDAASQLLRPRPAPAPGKYPHFTSTAVALLSTGESITSIVRFGVRYLPSLPDAIPEDCEAVLLAQLKRAAKRNRKTNPRTAPTKS
jgi:hypothetical protein